MSIILSSNKILNGDILVPANPGSPGKWPLNREGEIWFTPLPPPSSVAALKSRTVFHSGAGLPILF